MNELEPFIRKVVDVFDVGRREEKDLLELVLLSQVFGGGQLGVGPQVSGGSQGSSGSQGISTDILNTVLLIQALSPDEDLARVLVLVAILGNQGSGTQGNFPLPALVLLPALFSRRGDSDFLDKILRDNPGLKQKIMDLIQQYQGKDFGQDVDNLVNAAAKALERWQPGGPGGGAQGGKDSKNPKG